MTADDPPYRDPKASVDRRVSDLLDRMTVDEKVGQLVGNVLGNLGEEFGVFPLDEVEELVREYGFGSVAAPYLQFDGAFDPTEAVEKTNALQRTAVEETRLGIPLLFHTDAIHGHAFVDGATVFPHNLAMAATKDVDLVRTVARATGREMAATGARLNYNPTADVVRDQRWGRTVETYGESSRLVAEMVAAEVDGYQGDGLEEGVVATPKHFPAYGRVEGGEDAAPNDISETTLYRTFLPPFEAAIDAGAGSVMPCYNSIDAEPVHGLRRFLGDILRERLGFEGFVTTDWNGLRMLHEDHRVSRDLRESVERAMDAGVDVASIGGRDHAVALCDLVESGDISESRIDRSVERVLRTKFELGLFEDPYVDPDGTDVVGSAEHRELSLDAARAAMTLLKNEDDTLPFDPGCGEVLVTGPNASNLVNQVGGWSAFDPEGTTVLEWIREVVDEATVTHEQGSGIHETVDVATAVDAATTADAAVVVLGEPWYLHEFGPEAIAGPTGSFPTRSDLTLPAAQRELLEAIQATDTPTALVLIAGRPLAIRWAADEVPAILMAYCPGSEGGVAVAETLFGRNDPSGSLPVSVPRSAGHLPTRFDHLPHPHPVGEGEHPPTYDPLFEFGHGLSYTEFTYSDLSIAPATLGPGDTVTVEITVRNSGDRPGGTAVHCYLRDEVSSRVTPVRELAGVETISLDPGRRCTASFTIPVEEYGVVGHSGELTVEPGEYVVTVGNLDGRFIVEGGERRA